MGIPVEFNPELALRAYGTKGRATEECLPEEIIPGETYFFLKQGQRNYYFGGEIPLRETKGKQQVSRPLASVHLLTAEHHLREGKVWTQGTYQVKKVFDPNDNTTHFEGLERRTT